MELLACGFNAHGQLMTGTLQPEGMDQSSFVPVLDGFHIQVVFTGWSRTLVVTQPKSKEDECELFISHTDSKTWGRLKVDLDIEYPIGCVFGDYSGPLGYISRNGELQVIIEDECLTEEYRYGSENITTDDSPKIALIAINGAGRVCAIPAPAFNATVVHLLEFECFGTVARRHYTEGIHQPVEKGSFLSWFLDPTDPSHYPKCHHMLPGPCKQLVANSTTFAMLNGSGELFTWGDGRYPAAFGRPISKSLPATRPCLVSAMNYMGTKVKSVATGGTITVAKTDRRDFALVWGSSILGEPVQQVINNVKGQEPGQASLIQLGSVSFPASISKIAVGNGHVLVVDDKGDLWAAGRNDHGQLGLGKGSPAFVKEWKRVELALYSGQSISKVVCGDVTSFLVIKKKS